MRRVVVSKVFKETGKIGRNLGKELAERVKPGDTLDFSGFTQLSISTVDEFVFWFLKKHGFAAFKELRVVPDTRSVRVLFKRSLIKHTFVLEVKDGLLEQLFKGV